MFDKDEHNKRVNLTRLILMSWLAINFCLNPLLSDSGLHVFLNWNFQDHRSGEFALQSETHHHDDDLFPSITLENPKQGDTTKSIQLDDLPSFSSSPSPLLPPPKDN